MFSSQKQKELYQTVLTSLSQLTDLIVVPKDPVLKKKEMPGEVCFGDYMSMRDTLPKNFLSTTEDYRLNSRWIKYRVTMGAGQADFLIYPEDMVDVIQQIAVKHPILADFLTILSDGFYEFNFAKWAKNPRALAEYILSLFKINLTEITKKVKAHVELTPTDQQYVDLLGPDLFTEYDELDLFQHVILSRVCKSFDEWAPKFIRLVGANLFFQIVLPHVFACQAKELLNKVVEVNPVKAPKDELKKSLSIPALIPSYHLGPLDNKSLFSADTPGNKEDTIKLFNFMVLNKIHHVIIISDSPSQKHDWFKVTDNFLAEHKELSEQRRRQLEIVVYYHNFLLQDISGDRHSTDDLRDRSYYKLKIKNLASAAGEEYFLDVYCFKAKDNQFEPNAREFELLADLYEIYQEHPLIIQADSLALRSSFKLAFQMASHQLQKRSSGLSGVNGSASPSPATSLAHDENSPATSHRGSPAPIKKIKNSSGMISVVQEGPEDSKKEAYPKSKPTVSAQGLLSQSKSSQKVHLEAADMIVGGAKRMWKGMATYLKGGV